MVKYIQTVFDHFVGLVLKGFKKHTCLGPCQISKMELFAKIVIDLKQLYTSDFITVQC